MILTYPLRPTVRVTRNFYYKTLPNPYWGGQHYGTDIIAGNYSTHLAEIISPGDGRGMGVPFYDYYRGYYYIWEGPNDWRMHMAHCDSYIAPAGIWGPVKQGQAVARADNTGVSLGDHVHIDWLNPQKMGPEAVWKPQLNAWAHDVEKWIGKDIGWTTQEDWFDMATETDLKKVVKGELDNWFRSAEFAMIVRQEAIGQIYNILFDHGVGAPDDERRLMRMSYTLEQNNRILFDVTPTVDPNDKRRMIDTRNMVKEIKDKVGA